MVKSLLDCQDKKTKKYICYDKIFEYICNSLINDIPNLEQEKNIIKTKYIKDPKDESFNSILSNLSRGSNVYFNNNKLLKSEEDEKKEVEKDKKNEINENEENNIIKRNFKKWKYKF